MASLGLLGALEGLGKGISSSANEMWKINALEERAKRLAELEDARDARRHGYSMDERMFTANREDARSQMEIDARIKAADEKNRRENERSQMKIDADAAAAALKNQAEIEAAENETIEVYDPYLGRNIVTTKGDAKRGLLYGDRDLEEMDRVEGPAQPTERTPYGAKRTTDSSAYDTGKYEDDVRAMIRNFVTGGGDVYNYSQNQQSTMRDLTILTDQIKQSNPNATASQVFAAAMQQMGNAGGTQKTDAGLLEQATAMATAEAADKGGFEGPWDNSDFPGDGSRSAFINRRAIEIVNQLQAGTNAPTATQPLSILEQAREAIAKVKARLKAAGGDPSQL